MVWWYRVWRNQGGQGNVYIDTLQEWFFCQRERSGGLNEGV